MGRVFMPRGQCRISYIQSVPVPTQVIGLLKLLVDAWVDACQVH